MIQNHQTLIYPYHQRKSWKHFKYSIRTKYERSSDLFNWE